MREPTPSEHWTSRDRLSWRALLLCGCVTAAFIVPTSRVGQELREIVPRFVRSAAPSWTAAAGGSEWRMVERAGTIAATLVLGVLIAPLYRVLGSAFRAAKIPEETRRPGTHEPDA